MDAQDFRSLQEAYMEVYNELDEGAAADLAARAQKLARQRKGQTPQRKEMYKKLAKQASERANPSRSGTNDRSNMTPEFRRERRGMSDWNIEHDQPGTVTKNPKKLRKQRALGEIGEQVDIYDIILSHLLDEGYAETPEAAEVIMVNMSEEWREEIVEEMLDEGMTSYERNRQRAAQRAAARNAARAQGKTGAVPGVGYVSPRKERETWTDESGHQRHTSGARMPKKD
jgi:hypothetical protein